ncbi:hypothetical protein BC831DRAFT_481489 [Entophlyctis helioformis]|nr:hypothetical protein BC831DRAFT_481489 [Entophlyctis helioformis]
MTRTNRTNTIAVQTHDRSIPRNGRTDTTKKGGAGQGNWGKPGDELTMQEAHDLASSPPKTLSSAALAVNKVRRPLMLVRCCSPMAALPLLLPRTALAQCTAAVCASLEPQRSLSSDA